MSIGFDRSEKRSSEVIACVLREGTAAKRFIATWPSARRSGTLATPTVYFEEFDGNRIWCSVTDEYGYELDCNGNTCTYGEWATLRANTSEGIKSSPLSVEQPGVPGWGCGNGCTIYFLLSGNFAFWCPGNEDLGDPNGGGTNLPSDFTCTPQNPSFNQTVTCELVVSGHAIADDTVYWRFDSSAPAAATVVEDTSSLFIWSGKMVMSGMVSVHVVIDGLSYDKEATVTVTSRSGWSWASRLNGSPNPVDIDDCFTNEVGLTASKDCKSSVPGQANTPSWLFSPLSGKLGVGDGLTFNSVSNEGPNSGLWYLESMTAYMDLRYGMVKRWRQDGPSFTASLSGCASTMLKIASANACYTDSTHPSTYSAAFDSVKSTIEGHEAQHKQVAIIAAMHPDGDFGIIASKIVGKDSSTLVFLARQRMEDAHDFVFEASELLDTTFLLLSPFIRTLDYNSHSQYWFTSANQYAR